MGEPRRPAPAPADPDGGGDDWAASPMFLLVAIAIAAGGFAGWWLSTSAEAPAAVVTITPEPAPAEASSPVAPTPPAPAVPAAAAPVVVAAAVGTAPVAIAPTPRQRDPDGDQTPDLADYVYAGEQPAMADVIDRLHMAGVHTGLGAFSPPGTRPALVGIAVPEDFVLPEGYVRHYQATDDGQRIEPILMFAPDHEFVDASGRPITVPKDRVVPPELALPGMPIRRIVIPAPTDASRVRS